jgi:hypothetical protein
MNSVATQPKLLEGVVTSCHSRSSTVSNPSANNSTVPSGINSNSSVPPGVSLNHKPFGLFTIADGTFGVVVGDGVREAVTVGRTTGAVELAGGSAKIVGVGVRDCVCSITGDENAVAVKVGKTGDCGVGVSLADSVRETKPYMKITTRPRKRKKIDCAIDTIISLRASCLATP